MPKTILLIMLGLGLNAAGWASNTRIAAGGSLTLSSDLVLAGSDTLEVLGTAADSCTINGNSHAIRTNGAWSGLVRIMYAHIQNLGVSTGNGIDLTGSGSSLMQIEHCTFDRSSTVNVVNNPPLSTMWFRHNVILENSIVPVSAAVESTGYCFSAHGSSMAPKYFQANRIHRAHTEFNGPNWKVGGADSSGNIFIGPRVRLDAYGAGTVVSYNYLHILYNLPLAYWSQVHTVTSAGGALAEYNVIRDGEWIVQMCEGDFRYNVICDISDHNLYRGGSKGRFYRNIFFASRPNHWSGEMFACMTIYGGAGSQYDGPGVEIFNNIFDGCGQFQQPGMEVTRQGFIKSLRNNVFCRFALDSMFIWTPNAIVNTGWGEPHADTTFKPRIGYADYNLFYNPASTIKDHYYVTVGNKTERVDNGFAKNDVPVGGTIDAEADPKFAGPMVNAFPFNDTDIVSGSVTVAKMLKFFWNMYTPVAGSPLIDAGDPADGIGTDIGVVETGTVGIQKAEGKGRFSTSLRPEWGIELKVSPNPFDRTIAISIQAPAAAGLILPLLRLSILNTAGKLISAVVDQNRGPGTHAIVWNTAGMNSGVYIVRLQAGANIRTKHIVLSK
jgi:hypothetical protein